MAYRNPDSYFMVQHMSDVMQKYCDQFSGRFSAAKAFAFWKGRVALYAILEGLGIGEGDEVIVPGYTCVMDINPIMYLGAEPIYVDIEPVTYNMDVKRIEQRITPRTKVIIAQHTYGYPVEMDRLSEIAQKHNITIIEDCCLALGGRYRGKLLGTFGKASYFSFQWNKPMTTGLGGMAVCHDEALAEAMKTVCMSKLQPVSLKRQAILAAQLTVYRAIVYPRTTALIQQVFRWLSHKGLVVGSSSDQELEGIRMADDFFMGMSTVQSRAGLRQLAKVNENIEHRKRMTRLYDYLLVQRGWKISMIPEYMDPVLVRYPVRITEKGRAIEEAAKAGIELGTWFECPLHPKETKLELYGYQPGMCPEAERASHEVVNLPLHPRVSENTVRRTVDFICRFTQA